ncbi:MAG TPA: GxxExxY protein [Chlamydiales bacterium]|nr:GxxExxY protein [Chlamydiales bacterium]
MATYQDQELTRKIIAAAIEVHKHLGPGLLESAYRICLCLELECAGLNYKQELTVPLVYKNRKLDCGFRIDFLIENQIILELKSADSILPVHKAQLLTYLHLMHKQVGLLINFNVPVLKEGIRRCVLKAHEVLDEVGSLAPRD